MRGIGMCWRGRGPWLLGGFKLLLGSGNRTYIRMGWGNGNYCDDAVICSFKRADLLDISTALSWREEMEC